MGRQIVLVRHATPRIDPVAPPSSWGLNEQGRREAKTLGQRLAEYGIKRVVTSLELKAVETGEAIASGLGFAVSRIDELGEQGLGRVPWLDDPAEFQVVVERHFAQPDQRVLGAETSVEAGVRFARVVAELAEADLPALVSHGRIISAWLASISGQPAMGIWLDLRMPDALLVDVEAGTWSRIEDE